MSLSIALFQSYISSGKIIAKPSDVEWSGNWEEGTGMLWNEDLLALGERKKWESADCYQ